MAQDLAMTPKEIDKAKYIRSQKEGFQLAISAEETLVVAVAISQDQSKNIITRINCRHGVPISGYAYDPNLDSLYLECRDFMILGLVPLSMKLTVKGVQFWSQHVPLSESLIRKVLSLQQKRDYLKFKADYADHEIQFVQMLNPN